jgi:uncharacterized OsmC-like protein
MSQHHIATALQRARRVLERRPEAGLHDDAPALARWQGGTRIVASHPSGAQMAADMPAELGGSGEQVSPGWLFRAGLSSCLATCIAMNAAARGIVLTQLEVCATSRSDIRGVLGMAETSHETSVIDDEPGAADRRVEAGPRDIELHVRLAADGATPESLRDLVEASRRSSPIPCAVAQATPVALRVEVLTAATVAA